MFTMSLNFVGLVKGFVDAHVLKIQHEIITKQF